MPSGCTPSGVECVPVLRDVRMGVTNRPLWSAITTEERRMHWSMQTGPTAFDDWQERICNTSDPLRARHVDDAPRFSGGVASANLGAVMLAEVAASRVVVERTPRLIRRDDPELYKFAVQVSGDAVLEQSGR